MLNDYKPTHDPNLDTFKVQYLLGISAILAILFPHNYRFSEVRHLYSFAHQVRALTIPRSFGRSRFGWNQSLFSLNSSCYSEPVKLIQLLHTTSPHWECTELFIFQTGCTVISPKLLSNDHSSPSLFSLESFRLCSTRISSISIITSMFGLPSTPDKHNLPSAHQR